MRTLLALLPALACGAMMLVCMRMMMGGRRHDAGDESAQQEAAQLREEVARLRAERILDERKEQVDG